MPCFHAADGRYLRILHEIVQGLPRGPLHRSYFGMAQQYRISDLAPGCGEVFAGSVNRDGRDRIDSLGYEGNRFIASVPEHS